ncbi:hypothetical protein CI238_04012, partial [Colletotrichum incanum]
LSRGADVSNHDRLPNAAGLRVGSARHLLRWRMEYQEFLSGAACHDFIFDRKPNLNELEHNPVNDAKFGLGLKQQSLDSRRCGWPPRGDRSRSTRILHVEKAMEAQARASRRRKPW